MKTLQNNFTTPEQSKRLLELGVPADSADCCYLAIVTRYSADEAVIDYAKWVTVLEDGEHIGVHDLPCWSVGRLIEIFTTCAEYYTGDNSLVFNRESVSLGNINCLIPVIELAVKDKCIYFSKLED